MGTTELSGKVHKPQALVCIHAEMAKKINFACQQNSFPLLRNLRIENLGTEHRLDDLTVTLSSDPGFLRPQEWPIDRIAAGRSVTVQARDLGLSGEFLSGLSESTKGTVTIKIISKDDKTLAQHNLPVELLAYNEWGGAGFMPELLAAFSVPNDRAIDKILKQAANKLRSAGLNPSIDGYGSGSRVRVWQLAAAIYAAIGEMDITYSLPPTSFELDGQKIRLPGDIAQGRIATCLDTTLLFASCLEQAKLNPIIVLPEGHALVGVWLQPETLSTVVDDSAELLRKRIDLQDLILIETTVLTASPPLPFSTAITLGKEAIAHDKDDSYVATVDIKRARACRIHPLGLKLAQATGDDDDEMATAVELTVELPPQLPDFDIEPEEETPATPQTRLERWQRKLLDLSARNPLLSHRSPKTSLPIICPNPAELENQLSEGVRISIAPVPTLTSKALAEGIRGGRTGKGILEEYAKDALQNKQVLVDLSQAELQKKSIEIYRKAQTSLQEGGSNTLFLALGFLLWKRDYKSNTHYRAPLILMPVALERQSVRSGVKLVAHDDETKFNTTLLEMLHKDFRINIRRLDGTLPTDGSGVDVDAIWNKVRQAVKDVPGFEVVTDVVLGHFSFAKYLMWKDLVDRTEKLKEHPIVRHLIDTPSDSYGSHISFVKRNEVDQLFEPADLLMPLPADASQTAAVATAERGKDFIIIGPPGTGKSQTISNLITHILGKGKTVLFVSEKIAALNVVYRRLDEIGLGRFCLELHSNKAKKSDILAQLGKAWQAASSKPTREWELEAAKLKKRRDQLNQVVERLHTPRRNGMTAHEAMGEKIRNEEIAQRVQLSWGQADIHDKDQLDALRSAVKDLEIQACAVDSLADNHFQIITHGEWSPQWQSNIADKAQQLARASIACETAFGSLVEGALGIKLQDCGFSSLNNLAQLARVLLKCHRKQVVFALEPGSQHIIDTLEQALEKLRCYADAQASLGCSYKPLSWRNLNGAELAHRWSMANNSWFLKKFFAKRAIIQEMQVGGALGQPDPGRDADILRQLREEGEAINVLGKKLSFLKKWDGHDTQPEAIEELRALALELKQAISTLSSDVGFLTELRTKLRALLQEGNDLLAAEGGVGRTARNFSEKFTALAQADQDFATLGAHAGHDYFAQKENAFTAIKEATRHIVEQQSELNNWCSWIRRRTAAIDMDLLPLVKAVESGQVPIDEIVTTFEASYCTWWSGQLMTEDEVLRTFNTAEHTALIDKFRKLDDNFQKLTAAHVVAKLCSKLPGQNSEQDAQWGVLKRELRKKKRHKPVRDLATEIPNVFTTLAPCLMMSPLSVAQYLPAHQSPFDVVIFDEASQITVWDAVGVIARGKQIIMAGDPKQMPPTNFFARSDDDPDGDINQEGDLESILDEMTGARIPECRLNLHYRSRRESLITFSNNRYYDDSLITFPAPMTPDNGVSLVCPEGFYARGGARHNEGEAKAIVAEITRRLTHADKEFREQTIGVVTFNSEQQNLIEDLLDRERQQEPGIEWAFSGTQTEPVFVKNLETVQGDERDVILFSVTYGPDRAGHVTMNFGPLNREGGERRLNVALTRARSEMVVFSTLKPEHIDLSRSSAQAVEDLKLFLEYADKGPTALAAAVRGSVADFDSPFEIAVARELKRKGWHVQTQIGVSAYRIDLGIVHPDFTGRYLAGVECDGAMYHSAASARDRDKIRQAVLEGLGWTIFRVWSTDWWINKSAALKALDDDLHALLAEDRLKRKKDEPTDVPVTH